MFEKEAREYAIDNYELIEEGQRSDQSAREQSFQDGAIFGYSKVNEWHYVKDELPKMSEQWKICSDDILFVTVSDNKMHFGYFNSRKEFEEYNSIYRYLPCMVKMFCSVPRVPEELEMSEEA